MFLTSVRRLHTSSPVRSDLISKLRASIDAVKMAKAEQAQHKEPTPQHVTPPQPKKKTISQLPAEYLNSKYRNKYLKPPSTGALAEINGFFHQTQVKLEWTTAHFLDIPGERQRQEEERHMNSQPHPEDDDIGSVVKKGPTPRSVGLPEVVFLGKCNVGKSTLLNALLTQSHLKENLEFAFASRRAGFTQTMNCFNIGNRFKLIDTPGYGVKGKPEQGRQVMEYLLRRKELRRVYLLIGSKEGFSQDDFTIVDILVQGGVPFEIVFTKVDQLAKVSIVERHVKESNVLKLPAAPSIIFTGSETSRRSPKRQGVGELRHSIFEACGLSAGIKPLKFNTKATH